MKRQKFINLTQLKYKLFNFVHWYNNIRIHGSLNYLIPVEFRKTTVHIKSVIKMVANPFAILLTVIDSINNNIFTILFH
ncbi:IS3 family transposase [Spiroplasma endosymbiont of Polydrusus formosus]|uniref:IS3 family transposase n=1 Tax=Spiroplasma endosymbiont of Polydrusus formosus TaxID=3139326 RepID=UPI0035B53828